MHDFRPVQTEHDVRHDGDAGDRHELGDQTGGAGRQARIERTGNEITGVGH